MFDRLKLFYEWGFTTKEQLRRYVKLNAITQEEYEVITGEPYEIESS